MRPEGGRRSSVPQEIRNQNKPRNAESKQEPRFRAEEALDWKKPGQPAASATSATSPKRQGGVCESLASRARPLFSPPILCTPAILTPLNVGRHALVLLLLSQQEEPISSLRESTLFLRPPHPPRRQGPRTQPRSVGAGRGETKQIEVSFSCLGRGSGRASTKRLAVVACVPTNTCHSFGGRGLRSA